MKVLVLAAHPDDETLGCGATIHKLSKAGYEIQLITFTDGVGSRGDNQIDRFDKLENVCKKLKIKKYTIGSFPDNAMDTVSLLDLCKFIDENVDSQPDLIFTHFIGDLNIDHQLVAKATLTVFRPQYGFNHKIYSYYIPSSTDYNPTTTFDGNSYFKLDDEDVEKKISALKEYDVEMRDYPHTRSYKNIKNLMSIWGSEVGAEYCEKFKLVREVI
jgi:LmbE family N-acetylglucosaminyl deacetylase